MAQSREEAWVTYVPCDDATITAMVLAASLRETRTTRKIAVIVSRVVSKHSETCLRRCFDDVFFLNDNLVSTEVSNKYANAVGMEKKNLLRGKIFTFSLQIYGKCVFVPATAMFLENCDDLFSGALTGAQELIIRNLNGNMDMFLCTPNSALWEHLEGCLNSEQIGDVDEFLIPEVNAWLRNNCSKTIKLIDHNAKIGKFSLRNVGQKIRSGHHRLKMVHFVDIPENHDGFPGTLKSLQNNFDLGLIEKTVVGQWLNIFEDKIAKILADPYAAHHLKNGQRDYSNEPIAIIGMSCRFPGASNLEEFWKLMHSGNEGISSPPTFRWKREHSIVGVTGKEKETKAGFLSVPVDEFDYKFFGISPKEATYLDPQARLLHEVLWESLENSGTDPLSLRGSHTGIFTGSWMNDYKDIVQTSAERDFFRTYMGNSIGATAARLSFLLGLTGPSIATESGCSSAIVAVDLAVKSLRNRETNLAIAGGVNLLLHPFQGNIIDYVIAPDGRCKTFDEKANGFGRAEGCGVLVLKRLSDALRDRDPIWAMIRGSAISQEGLSRSMGTPTVHCEALAMQLALNDSGIRAEQVSFLETHGTGTSVGDPMEVAAISQVYHSDARKDPLIIGSVKTNVGHTESCSGITGIIKTVLAMQNEIIPKHLNFDTLNPEINLDSIPAMIPLEPIPWPIVQGQPRLAGVSSFGITGTDGHVIVQEAPDYTLPKFTIGLERPIHLIKFSAKTKQALDDLLKLYQQTLRQHQDVKLSDIAYSANTGKASFNHRAFTIATTIEEVDAAIQSDKLLYGDTTEKECGKICFLFTGQGCQYAGMAKTLYETSPVFRIHFDQCDAILKQRYSLSLQKTLWESGEDPKEISRTIYSQTSIFCVEYCLLKLWESWGIRPDYVLGHSLGEFCAAVAAGILTFEDALMLVAERSRLIDQLPQGSMLVIKASQPEVETLMKISNTDLEYAAINSSEQTVVAGDTGKILELVDVCKKSEVKTLVLEATHAFHSKHMDPMLNEYRKIAESVKYSKPVKCQYISGMTGSLLKNTDADITASYWVSHTREKVSFLDACRVLKQLNCQHFVEIGPQPILSTLVMQNVDNQIISCYPSLRRNTNDWETILNSLGKLYLNGVNVSWEGYDEPYLRNKVPSKLPCHPFYRKSFWSDCSTSTLISVHPLIGSQLSNATVLNIFQNNLTLKSVPYLKDHCIGERIVMPGAGFAEMCLSAGHCVANSLKETLERPKRPVTLENLTIEAPLEIIEGKICRLQVVVDLPENCSKDANDAGDSNSAKGFRVKVFHQKHVDIDSIGKWQLHTSCVFNPVAVVKDIMNKWNKERVRELISTLEPVSTGPFYKRIDMVGLRFGDSFRSIEKYWGEIGESKKSEIVAQVKLPNDHDNYLLHPVVIDAMIQAVILSSLTTLAEVLTVPTKIGKLVWLGDIAESSNILYLHSHWENDNCFVFAADENLKPIAVITDVQMIETTVKTIESILQQQNSDIPESWEVSWKPIPGPLDNRAKLPIFEPVLTTKEFAEKLKVSTIGPEDYELEKRTKRMLYLYQVNALFKLGWSPTEKETFGVNEFCDKYGILSMYRQLVHHYFSVCHDENGMMQFDETTNSWRVDKLPPPEEEVDIEIKILHESLKFEEKVEVVTRVYSTIGERLDKILCGEESVLPLLFPTDADQHQKCSADVYYQNHPGRSDLMLKANKLLAKIYESLRAINDDPKIVVRILEVGAGTGSLTQEVLPHFVESGAQRVEYYYTDISGSFFAKAEVKFEKDKKHIKFCTFDIEKSGLSQGVPLNYFDFVYATDVLHVTQNLEETLKNLRATLRPGGCLFFTETVTQDRGITFVFGLLGGYWRFTDFKRRPRHPCVGTDTWRHMLNLQGFEFVHITETFMGTLGIFVGQAFGSITHHVEVDQLASDKKRWLVFGLPDQVHQGLLIKLSASGFKINFWLDSTSENSHFQCQDLNVCVDRVEYEHIATKLDSMLDGSKFEGIIYGWGMDTLKSDQRQISLPFLHLAKKLLTMKNPPKLFVCAKGVHSINPDLYMVSNPSASTLCGMAKSLKNENSDIFVRCMDLEYDAGNESDQMVVVDEILYEMAMHKESREKERVQVAYRNGQRYETKFSGGKMLTSLGEELKLPSSTGRYQLVLPQSRVIQDLVYDVLEEEPVGDLQVEVKIKSYALNFKDVLTILKPIPVFENFNGVGMDYAGVVTKVGKGVPGDRFSVGDKIFGVNIKDMPLHSHLITNCNHVMKIPKELTFAEASTLPVVAATSLYSLMDVAKMRKGETVLIHTGSGGVGLFAIQIAKHVGATIVTTAGSPRKQAYLRSIGIEHVFHSRNTAYREEILKVTGGRGVDIVLNSLTGPGFKEASLDVTATNGRFVEMSKLSVWTEDEVRALRPDVQYTIIDLMDEKQFSWKDLFARTEIYLKEGNVHAIPYVKFDALLIRQALQFLQKAKHIGKVVVTMPEVKLARGKWKVNVPLFNEDSTYIITGGMGGIGFEVCKWMLAKGATNIVLIGRNPPNLEISKEIVRLNTSNRGYNVTVKQGDIGDFDACKAIIDEIVASCGDKTIRGIQHCAGVLRDNMYAEQTWEAFDATFNPKVEGTWNLHKLTRDLPLEHFVLYSSITALAGTPSQANHVAANCFEDAFAHYRYSLGLPATTINWGQWAEVGCAKEINLTGVLPVSVKRMLKGLEVTLRRQITQSCYGDFESMRMWTMICPVFKYTLDERLLKSIKDDDLPHSHLLLNSDKFWQEMDEAPGKEEKLQVVMLYMKEILRGALRMESDEPINENANMQDLGVDSLMLIELKNSIQGLMGSRLNITNNMLKDCHTIRDLSTVIVNKMCDNDEHLDTAPALTQEEYASLLKADCILEENLRPSGTMTASVNAIKTVLITGVTGQLGPYIIEKLMGESAGKNLEKIICLVRTKDEKYPKEKLENVLKTMNLLDKVDMSKVRCLRGDVTQQHLGLSDEDYQGLSQSVDCVIHLAAKSNHVEAYRKFEEWKGNIRSVNVEGTLNILRFAVNVKTKYVYYASSILSVFGGNNEKYLCDDWPGEDEIKIIAENNVVGYPTSKYVCEMLMKQANERGIPCKVFRFPWILGDSLSGQLNYLNNHYILRFLSYLKIKAIPTAPMPAVVLPVDVCADLSLKLFWNENAPNEIYNIAHPCPQMEVEFIQVAEQHFGVHLELVEWKSKEFVETLYAKDMPLESLKEIYENVDKGISAGESDSFKAIRGYIISPEVFFKNPKVENYLPQFSQQIPSTMDMILQNLLYVKSKRFFEKFGI